jgi:two-component system chemotaxis response regulator CheB
VSGPAEPIDIMVVEDSATVREFLVGLIASRPEFRLVATARDGRRALEMLKSIPRPGIITMDLEMPVMDGVEAVGAIMEKYPVPIVLVTSRMDSSEGRVFKAMEAGAVAAVRLPPGPGLPGHDKAVAELFSTLRAMAEVRVIRRWAKGPGGEPRFPAAPAPEPAPTGLAQAAASPVPSAPPAAPRPLPVPVMSREAMDRLDGGRFQIAAVGASTGGPLALKDMLRPLRPGFPAPILIVQHMAYGFTQSFAAWLGEEIALPVAVAAAGMRAEPGRVYVAPEGGHMEVDAEYRLRIRPPGPRELLVPSVARLFASVQRAFGPTAVAILLTGMGKDGAEEMAALRRAGALTVAQDGPSSVVHGMPGEAIKLDGASLVLPPPSIAAVLERAFRRE